MKKMGLFDNDGPTMDADLSVLSDDASVGNGVALENATDVELNVLDFDSLDLDSLKSESKELDSMDFNSLDLDSLKSESKELDSIDFDSLDLDSLKSESKELE